MTHENLVLPANACLSQAAPIHQLARGFLITTPRWLFLTGLIFAPWAYGCTRPWAVAVLAALLGLVVFFWVAGCIAHGRKPRVPTLAVFTSAALLAQGWWMTINAGSVFDPASEELVAATALAPSLRGTSDARLSLWNMMLWTAMLGAFLFCCDLVQHDVWRRRLWMAIALTGSSLAIFGILQKLGVQSAITAFWEPAKWDIANNFASFRYRANAGAWLNLTLPVLCGLVTLKFRNSSSESNRLGEQVTRARDHWEKAAWVGALSVVVWAIQLNASRASGCVALLIAAAILIRLRLLRRGDGVDVRKVWMYSAVIGTALLMLAAITTKGWTTGWERLHALGANIEERSPTPIYLQMVAQAGLTGFGPGTFKAVFPGFQRDFDPGSDGVPAFWITGYWEHAHQDYLQTLIEWGWLGAGLWAILIGGGIVRAVTADQSRLTSAATSNHGSGGWMQFCSLAALIGVLLHALVDFPLQIASIQLYFFTLLAMCWSGSRTAQVRAIRL